MLSIAIAIAMLSIFAGKRRRWQRVSDGGREKRRRDDSSTDRTCLLSRADEALQSPNPNPESTVGRSCLLSSVHEASENPNPRPESAGDIFILASGRDGEEDPISPNPSPHSNPSSESFSDFCNPGDRDDQKRLERWVSDMDEYLAASRLCREEATAASLLTERAQGLWWPSVEKKKKISSSSSCKALNGGQCRSWRGLKKLLSKQFMPFSSSLSREGPHGMHHLSRTSTTSKRSSRVFSRANVAELRKMDARIQDGVNKHAFIMGSQRLKEKENQELNRQPQLHTTEAQVGLSSTDSMNLKSQYLALKENRKKQRRKQKENAIVRKVNTLLSKASNVALEVCDILNLE